jgi:signal transduction histidine kinase
MRFSRRQLGLPVALLLLSLGATGFAAAQAWLAVRRYRATAEQLLHDYAAFATWTYASRASNELQEAAWIVLNPVLHEPLHQSPMIPESRHLPGYYQQGLVSCECDPAWRPGTYFSFTVGSDTLSVTGTPLATKVARWLRDSLNVHVRGTNAPRLGLVTGRPDSAPVLLAYGLMPTIRRDTILYGFTFEPKSLTALFPHLLATYPALPPAVTGGRAQDSLLALRITLADGTPLYVSPEWPGERYVARDTLPARAAGLGVEATALPLLVRGVLAADTPRTALGVLLGTVLLAAALSVVAVRQLRRERDLARQREAFVQSVSHELRTPLAQIRLFLETLRFGRYRSEDEREWLLSHVDRESLRLSHLVENVLRFSRSGRGDAAAGERPPVDLAAETADIVAAFEPLATSRRARVETATVPGAVVGVDRAAYRQVLLNLLDNAVKYGPGGQTIAVSVEGRNGVVRVAVADHGPGIPPAERDRVWEPYVRGEGATVRAVGGSGIGLSVVRDVVEQHGGRAWIEDTAGGGTTVIVELPALAEATSGERGA